MLAATIVRVAAAVKIISPLVTKLLITIYHIITN